MFDAEGSISTSNQYSRLQFQSSRSPMPVELSRAVRNHLEELIWSVDGHVVQRQVVSFGLPVVDTADAAHIQQGQHVPQLAGVEHPCLAFTIHQRARLPCYDELRTMHVSRLHRLEANKHFRNRHSPIQSRLEDLNSPNSDSKTGQDPSS